MSAKDVSIEYYDTVAGAWAQSGFETTQPGTATPRAVVGQATVPRPTVTTSPGSGSSRKPFIGTTIDHWAANETAVGTMKAIKLYTGQTWPLTWGQVRSITNVTPGVETRTQINVTIRPNPTTVATGTSLDQSFKDFVNSIPVRTLTDQYGNVRPGVLIQYQGEVKHEGIDPGNWKTGAKKWATILKGMNRPDLWFGVCLQDFQFPISIANDPAPNISTYYDSGFTGLLNFIAVDVYSDWPGNGSFGKQHATIGANTKTITDYFKANWPGIRIYTAELGIGETTGGGTPTKATVMTNFYNAMVTSGICEAITYFDRTVDPLKSSTAATNSYAAINADSKAV